MCHLPPDKEQQQQQQKQQRRRRLSTCPQVGLNCQTERHSDSVQYIMKTFSHTHILPHTHIHWRPQTHRHTHTERALWFSGLQAVPLIKTCDQRQLAKATSTIFSVPLLSILCSVCLSFLHPSLSLPHTSHLHRPLWLVTWRAGRLVVLTMAKSEQRTLLLIPYIIWKENVGYER